MTLDSRPTHRHQQGNTLTGVIIGLIVGLVIAVIVALAITKGATPFTDKSGKVGKSAEPTAGQAADPNRPLYGKQEAAREANKAIQEKAKPVSADPIGDAIANLKTDAKPDAKPVPPPAPVARPAAPAKPDAAEDEKFTYFLQAGAFREISDAENTRARLALLGFEAVINDRVTDSGILHRVRLGPYSQVEQMNKTRAKLVDSGVDVAIVRIQK